MAGVDRDLVAALRAELAGLEPARPCDRAALLAGLGGSLAPREPALARLAIRLGGRAGPDGGPGRRRLELPPAAFSWTGAPEHCRAAWLRGRFLARGSLSLTLGRAHLEFTLPPAEAEELARRLAEAGLPAGLRIRRGKGVVTWKRLETITAFLARAGAGAALLELEARSVARILSGELNRVLNAESANLQRSVAAAGRQLAAIAILDDDGRLRGEPATVRAVAEARRDSPEATLAELATRLELHRSAVQRALDRLERLALHDDEGIGRRGRAAASGARAGRGARGQGVGLA